MMKIYGSVFVLILAFSALLFTSDANAQTRRKKVSQRSNAATRQQPPRQPARTLEPAVISTADDILRAESEDNADEPVVVSPTTGKSVKSKRNSAQNNDSPPSQRDNTIELTRQINELTDKIKSLETQQRGLVDLEKLSRAEERAEALRRQLAEATAKEAELNLRLEQLEEQARPENIQREAAVVGSTRPEEVRAARLKIVENEKQRTRDQIAQIQTNRARLETAIANADSLVDKLRARVETDDETSIETPSDAAKPTETPADDPNEQEINP